MVKKLTKEEFSEMRRKVQTELWQNPEYKENMKKSHKRKYAEGRGVFFKKGHKIWLGRHHTKDSKKKMRLKNYLLGKSYEEVFGKERANEIKKKWWSKNIIKPNKPEKIMINIIKENNLPFNYVGNGQVIIGGFCPDFLSKNPKYIIEVNGDYWHNLPKAKEKDKRKLKTYSKYGYKTLTIWEHELKNPNQVLNKINNFIGR